MKSLPAESWMACGGEREIPGADHVIGSDRRRWRDGRGGGAIVRPGPWIHNPFTLHKIFYKGGEHVRSFEAVA